MNKSLSLFHEVKFCRTRSVSMCKKFWHTSVTKIFLLQLYLVRFFITENPKALLSRENLPIEEKFFSRNWKNCCSHCNWKQYRTKWQRMLSVRHISRFQHIFSENFSFHIIKWCLSLRYLLLYDY